MTQSTGKTAGTSNPKDGSTKRAPSTGSGRSMSGGHSTTKKEDSKQSGSGFSSKTTTSRSK